MHRAGPDRTTWSLRPPPGTNRLDQIVIMDTNTAVTLQTIGMFIFFGWLLWLMIRTDPNDTAKARAQGYKDGIEFQKTVNESTLRTAKIIAESELRQVESTHRHEVFMAELDEKYPEVSRIAKERDALKREVETLTARLEVPSVPLHEDGDILVQTDDERAEKVVTLP